MVLEVVLLRHFGLGFSSIVEASPVGLRILDFGASRSTWDGGALEYSSVSNGYFDFAEGELIASFWSHEHEWMFWSERTGFLLEADANYRFSGFGPLRIFHVGETSFRVPRRLLDWINTNCGYGIKEHEFSLPVWLVKHRRVGVERPAEAMPSDEWFRDARSRNLPYVEDIRSRNVDRFFDTSPAGRAEVRKYLQFDDVMMKRLIQDGAQILW